VTYGAKNFWVSGETPLGEALVSVGTLTRVRVERQHTESRGRRRLLAKHSLDLSWLDTERGSVQSVGEQGAATFEVMGAVMVECVKHVAGDLLLAEEQVSDLARPRLVQ
jgi:hypothetical protein